MLFNIHKQVKDDPPKAKKQNLHELEPGDWIVAEDLRRENSKAHRWNQPYQILLTTKIVVTIMERGTWIHASHYKPVLEPRENIPSISK